MSGHSKWHQIKHKKGAADSKRGQVFTKYGRLISFSARSGGGDPEMNPALRLIIEKAKADGLPNVNIERAIKKGTGELGDEKAIEEAIYEGYGPGGVALMIHSVTDNKNRALSSIRNIMTKSGGTLGAAGSVGWMFEQRGVLIIELPQSKNKEEIELAAIDAGATDLDVSDNLIEVYTAPKLLAQVKKNIEAQGIKVKSAELSLIAKEETKIEDIEQARRILALMDELEEDDDVTNISSNFNIAENILQMIAKEN